MAGKPPPLPDFAAPEVADKVWSIEDDGSRWRWNGAEWVEEDPPSTHAEEMTRRVRSAVVERVIHTAYAAIEESGDEDEAVEQIATLLNGDVSLARAARDALAEWGDDTARGAVQLVLRAV